MSLPGSYEAYDWHHDSDTDPIRILVELDAERWEVRKIHLFRDGTLAYATAGESSGDCELSDVAYPLSDEILESLEFTVYPITRGKFEQLWQLATEDVPHA